MVSRGSRHAAGGSFAGRDRLPCQLAGVVRSPGFFLKARRLTARTETAVVDLARAIGAVAARSLETRREHEPPCERLIPTQAAELELDTAATLAVSEHAQTSRPDDRAAGDCVEVPHLVIGNEAAAPLRDPANLEARCAEEHAFPGDTATFPGVTRTHGARISDGTADSTRPIGTAAPATYSVSVETAISTSPHRPGSRQGSLLVTQLVVKRRGRRPPGARCVGPGAAGARLTLRAPAIEGRLTIEDAVRAEPHRRRRDGGRRRGRPARAGATRR